MSCNAEREKYKIYLAVGGNTLFGQEKMSKLLQKESNLRIINLDSHIINPNEYSLYLDNNINYRNLKSDLQNRGILFALFVQHNFDGMLLFNKEKTIEKFEELFSVAQIQWDEEIQSKKCIVYVAHDQTTFITQLKEQHQSFTFDFVH